MKTTRTARKAGMLGISAALAAVMAVPGITAAQEETMAGAELRVLHGADAPAVDIWANGAPAITDLDFAENTDWIPLPAGDYQLQVTPAGVGIDDPANIVFDGTVTLTDGTMTTIVATGNLGDFGIVPQPVADAPAPSADMTDIKVGHMSWDAPPVNVVLGEDVVVADLAYPAVQGPLTVEGGAYDFDVVVAEDGALAIDIPELTFENGVAYSVYAIGSITNNSLTAVRLVDADTRPASVRVAHLSAVAGPVDVFVDGAAVLEGFEFMDVSPYLSLDAGEYRIQVAPAGAGADGSVIDAPLTFEAGSWTTVAAATDNGVITPLVFADAEPVAAEDAAKLRAYHASFLAPRRVDIATDGAAKNRAAVPDLRVGRNTGFLELPAGDLDLDLRQRNTKKVLLDLQPLGLEAGKVYSAFAIDFPPNGVVVITTVDAQ